ncbi:hypothetical protein IXB28_00530, partial [Leptothoe kymatousa TAU-MAC 1615]
PDGETLASASSDNTVKLWSKDGEELNTLKGHSSWVWSVAFSPDGETLASASDDNTVKLWNFQLEDLIGRSCDWLDSYFVKQSPELLMDLTICQKHNADWVKQAAPTLIANADNYLVQGKAQKTALEWYEQAMQWDTDFTFASEDRLNKLVNFRKNSQKIEDEDKDLPIIVQHFQAITSLDPPLQQTISEIESSWGSLCRAGSLENQAQAVLFACEEAIERAPFRPSSADNRGLAYALTGNTQAAIADFKTYIDRTTNQDKKAQRQQWVEALEKGENPFTPEVLESLRPE